MTTIAYRDGIIAADSQINHGDTAMGQTDKIVRRDDGGLCGVTGSMSAGREFIAWFLDARKITPSTRFKDEIKGAAPRFKEGDFEALVIEADGTIWSYDDCGHHQVRAPYVATGSGHAFALGAMWAGQDAANAVLCAARFDNFTGGDIISLSRDKPGDGV